MDTREKVHGSPFIVQILLRVKSSMPNGIWIGSCSPSMLINQEHVQPLGVEVAQNFLCFVPTTRTEGEFAKGYMSHHGCGLEGMRKRFVAVSAFSYRKFIENPLSHFSKGSLANRLKLFIPEAILDLPESGKGSSPVIAIILCLHDCARFRTGQR